MSRATTPAARPTTPNVLRVFAQATPEEIADGREWYGQARALAETLAERYFPRDYFEDGESAYHEYGLERAVGVIAVLSPRLAWHKNVELAQRMFSEWYATANARPIGDEGIIKSWPGLKSNARKALAILDGKSPFDVVGGPKVTAFFYAILNPNDPRGIVIDRHAFDVAVGRVMDDKSRGIALGRKGAYERFVRAYERAAHELRHEYPGITAAELQAITWVAWRRMKKEGSK